MSSTIIRFKLLFLSAFLAVGLIPHLACGGSSKTTVPGLPPLTMTLETPGEGIVVSAPVLHVRGQVSQPTATVALNRKSIIVRIDGRFETDVNLIDGINTLTLEAWTEATAREGRGSGLLPPSANAEARVIRTVTFQRGPLQLAVAAPQHGAIFSTASIQSSGVVSESDATLTINGNAVTLSSGGAFSTTLTLAEGSNTFTYLATGAGPGTRTATATRTITYTPPPPPIGPVVALTEPIEGTLTNADQVRVSGKVSDPSANLIVNGQGMAMDAQGAFTTVLSPPEGPLTITAIATNSSNVRGSDTRHILIDRTPPRITLTKPVPVLVNSRTLELVGVVDDPAAVLSLNNQGIVLDDMGNFHVFFVLSEGANHLNFRGVDPADNVGTLEVDTVCDTLAPVVTLHAPAEGLITNLHGLDVTGRVDDPAATLLVAGKSLKPNGDGSFTTSLSLSEGAQLIVALATDSAGNTGHATRSIVVDWTPPQLQWMAPTPAEGAHTTKSSQDIQASVSELAAVVLNGNSLALKACDYALEASATAAPYMVQSTPTTPEGNVLLVLEATDRAGNASRIERRFDCGLTTPKVVIESPSDDLQTSEVSAVLVGHVVCSDFVKPVTLTLNGTPVPLSNDLRFSLPVNLQEGQNTFHLAASSVFGQKDEATRTLYRFTSPVNVRIDWPLEGLVINQPSVEVRGRVFRPNCAVSVNGVNAVVDATTLTFKAPASLAEGLNPLVAVARDTVGNQGTDQVQVTRATKAAEASYRWDLPVDGSATRGRTIHIKGQADLPDIASIRINGQPMALSGQGQDGQFEGDLVLINKGMNTLLLEAHAANGSTSSQRRTVRFVPELPRIRLVVPDSARPGQTIPVQVGPEPGTVLASADVSWNSRLLARLADPFEPVQAQVPADAVIGSQIPVEAVAVDDQGETVTARAWVTVYGSGALLIEAYDDRKGLPFTDKAAVALVEGTREPLTLDEHGRVALPTALPHNWIKVSKEGYTPAWRSAGVMVGAVQAAVDTRLTPMETPRAVETSGFTGEFAGGALTLTLPPGAVSVPARASVTPLSTQGLPGLLPLGWSAVSAWWLDFPGVTLALPGSVSLTLPSTVPALPADAQFAWVRWDEVHHAWMVLAAGLSSDSLASLSLPSGGGFALVLADPAPQAPPMPVATSPLPAFVGQDWRDGLAASGGVEPSIMPTADAIHGAKASARFNLDFGSGDSVPSGAIVQVDVLESYTAIDQALIEPEGFSQDVAMARWVLTVEDGKSVVRCTPNALSLDLPVRMSRTFGLAELIEGRIAVGLYHDGTCLTPTGSTLLGATGGTLVRDGVNLSLAAGSLTGPTLVRLAVDSGDASAFWPEVSSLGSIAKSFTVDIVGTLLSGLYLTIDDLNAPDTARPLLLQRRVIQGQRLIVAVGELKKQGSAWVLATPTGGNPVLEGGSFAVLVPTQTWDWISGTALLPGGLARPLMEKLGAKARMMRVESKAVLNSPSEDVAVADVSIDGGFLLAVSGTTGAFAVPACLPAISQPITVKGSRWDLGVSGAIMASVPSAANALRLATASFRVDNVLPAELAEVGTGSVVEILLSTAADPATLANVKLYQEPQVQIPTLTHATPDERQASRPASKKTKKTSRMRVATKVQGKASPTHVSPSLSLSPSSQSAAPLNPVELPVRRRLSLDGRILILTPEASLPAHSLFRVVTDGLASLAGEAAPAFTRRFKTSAQPPIGEVDFSRISLSYPTEALDVTVSIPRGAVPPWSLVSVEAPLMGSYGEGVMPPEQDYSFTMKASLGERLKVSVQMRDGRLAVAFIGRYVAPDGRTTLGVDGGRVEGPGGLAVVVPEGALDGVAEMQVLSPDHDPVVSETSLNPGEALLKGIRLRVKGDVTFKKQPILEILAASLPGLAPQLGQPAGETELFGNGPLAIFQERKQILPDGSEDLFHVLVDTAQFSADGTKVTSLGGLRVPDSVQGTVVQQVKLAASEKRLLHRPMTHKTDSTTVFSDAKKTAQVGVASHSFGSSLAESISDYNWEVLQSMYYYHSGTVYRNWNGLGRCGGAASATCYGELPLAEVYRCRMSLSLDEARTGRLSRGRMLATCDDRGRYLNVGGPMAGATGGQRWISLFAVDPRTGETDIDPGSPTPVELGLPWERRDHSIAITSQGGNPFDPSLTAPRIKAMLVDSGGTARTMFTLGETAKLMISTEAGSQMVVRGRVSGSITQDFGSLPTEIPVSFTQEGTWKADILGWTAKPVQGAASLSVIVTPVGVLGSSLPGKPRILSRNPENGDTDVDPSVIVKMTFSEPVRNATATTFRLQVNGAAVPFKVISSAREVVSDATLVQEVWLMPDQRLSLGAAVVVGVSSAIVDQGGDALDELSWSFTVRGADEVGSMTGAGPYLDMVTNKGMIYAVEDLGAVGTLGEHKHAIRVIDATDPSNPKPGPLFGEHGSWDPKGWVYGDWSIGDFPFSWHEINGLRVAQGVAINGASRDVLMVLSRPFLSTEAYVWENGAATDYRSRHNTIWVFDITGDEASFFENKAPKLLMVSSLGTLSDNWGKGLGSAGGVLGCIRLRGGMTLWDGDQWYNGFLGDAQDMEASGQAWNGVQVLARRARISKGYYPGPATVVASNGFYNPISGSKPSVTSAVITEDADGRPIGFATMGHSEGRLVYIQTDVGSPKAMATFMAGGCDEMDSRVRCFMNDPVNGEPANQVEVIKGSWQGTRGTEHGTLLLVGTEGGSGGTFWVIQPDLATSPMLTETLAKASLPGRITKIVTDPAKMLVAVQAGEEAYVFSLRGITGDLPLQLVPLTTFKPKGGFALEDGFLYSFEDVRAQVAQIITAQPGLLIRNIEGTNLESWNGIPIVLDWNKFFAGAFYDYNAAMLGNPNPDQTPHLAPKLMCAMIKAQKKNDQTPYLRHYYPDLGERYLTATVKMNSPVREKELADPTKGWFMEGKGSLFVKGREIPGAVVIEGQRVENGQLVANMGTPRCKPSRTEFETTDVVANPVKSVVKTKHSEISAPYRFFIKDDVLAQYDTELRGDRDSTSFVRIEFKLYENETKYAAQQAEGEKRLEFTVKFNSNTTLFDVVRGGTWYYDPVVSGDLPGYAQRNPLIQSALDGWATRQTTDVTGCAEFDQAVMRRLSLSQADRIASQPSDLFGTKAEEFKLSDLSRLGLDSIQAMLERLFVGLRRRVYPDVNGKPSNTEPMPFGVAQDRPTFIWFGSKPMGPNASITMTGDVPGAFGYRTAQVVNAIQRMEKEDMGIPDNEKSRNLDRPLLWQHDPGLQKEDLDHRIKREDGTVIADPIDGRIMPVINQRFRINGELNPTNTLVQYWVAYPRLRKQHEPPRDSGLAALNTMLTRDLVLGPTDPDHPDDVKEREALNTWINRVNAIPEPRDWQGPESTEVYQLFNEQLSQECLPELVLEGQTIYRADRNLWNLCKGQWYNTGIGILQMAMNPKWGRPFDKTSTLDNPTQKNPFVRIIAQPVTGKDDDRVRQTIRDFLVLHYKAPRIDVYVNGMATVAPQMERAVDQLQQNLDLIERVGGRKGTGDGTQAADYRYPQAAHVPVLGVFNQTSVSLDGKAISFDPWDAKDILDNQEDAAFPGRPTQNPDAERLIVVLRELVCVLWDPEFEQTILEKWQHEPGGAEEGRAWLQGIRKKLTLHAHSQGARVAAVAKTRLETIRPLSVAGRDDMPQSIDVASQFDYVDYGNGAGISMWWKQFPGYRSYVHHVNQFDAVSIASGLYPSGKVKLTSLLDDAFASLNLVLQTNGFLMAPNPLFKDPEGNRWLNIKRNVVTSPHPDVTGGLFARYAEAISGLWSHTFVVHDSFCKTANTDNHDILGAYLCNLSRNEEDVKFYEWIITPWAAGTGTFGYRQGAPVCENGDCGGTDSTTTEIASGARLKGLLQVDIDGDLPPGVEARVEIRGTQESSYPAPVMIVRSVIQHPVLPGTYHLWAYPVQAGGRTYWGRIEYLSGNVLTSIDIRGGHAIRVKVKYELQ